MEVRLQPLARRKVAALGEEGAAWSARLPGVLDDLARRWELTWERALPGGSASYVLGARTASGEQRVVKVGLPGRGEDSHEAAVLEAAAGRGYAELHAVDVDHDALLLERLGPSLQQEPKPPERTLDVLVDTLREAWTAPADVPEVDRATELHDLVVRFDDRHRACDPAVRRQALAYAEHLATTTGATAVVCHGDPHPGNALACARTGGHALVDPDGLRCEAAYDLGVALREWNPRVAEGGRPMLERWCTRVAARAGVDRDRVWRWAFLERVSTGLYVLDLGAERLARPFLETARLLVDPNPGPTRLS